MKTLRIKSYTFDELSDKAKEKARDWYRQGSLDYEWWDTTLEDAVNVGLKITSFDLSRHEITGVFIGTPLETVAKIKSEHGEVCETYKTALRYEPSLRACYAAAQTEDAGMIEEEAYENSVHEFLLDLLEDYRVILQHEEDYLTSDESVDESIRANDYAFTEDGSRQVTL